MGSEDGRISLHVVEGAETGCNSLRPPDIKGKTRPVQVAVTSLDEFLRRNAIERIDFMKMDVEGAEWSVLQGAVTLLKTAPRPFVMIEVSDLRTRPWGYRSKEIAKFLRNLDFDLFRPAARGLAPMDVDDVEDGSDFNVIAAPHERVSEVGSFLVKQGAQEELRPLHAVGSWRPTIALATGPNRGGAGKRGLGC